MIVLLLLALVVGCLIVVPLLLVVLAIRLAIGLAFLPFRIAGLAIRLALGLVFALVLGLCGLILAGAVILIPLLPIAAVVFGIWLIVRLSRRQPAARMVTEL